MKIQSDLTNPVFFKKNIKLLEGDTSPGACLDITKGVSLLSFTLTSDYHDMLFMAQITNEDARFLAKSLLVMIGEGK